MPKINSKPVVCIYKPERMTNLNLNLYIDPSHVSCIVSNADSEIERWAKSNRIEWVCYLPQWNVYKDDAKIIRDKDMIDFSDVLIVFWDNEDFNILEIIEYAQQVGCPYICHFIKDLD